LFDHTPELFILKELIPETLKEKDTKREKKLKIIKPLMDRSIHSYGFTELDVLSPPHPVTVGCSPPGLAGLQLCEGL